MGVADIPSFTGREYDPLVEMFAAASGQRITSTEALGAFGYKASWFASSVRTDKQILEKQGRSEFKPIFGFISGSPKQVKRRIRIVESQRKVHFAQMHNYINTARSLGVSERDILQELKNNGLNKNMVSALRAGNYIPYEPSDNMRGQIRNSFKGAEKLATLREARRAAWAEERKRRASGKPLAGARPND